MKVRIDKIGRKKKRVHESNDVMHFGMHSALTGSNRAAPKQKGAGSRVWLAFSDRFSGRKKKNHCKVSPRRFQLAKTNKGAEQQSSFEQFLEWSLWVTCSELPWHPRIRLFAQLMSNSQGFLTEYRTGDSPSGHLAGQWHRAAGWGIRGPWCRGRWCRAEPSRGPAARWRTAASSPPGRLRGGARAAAETQFRKNPLSTKCWKISLMMSQRATSPINLLG